MVNFNNNDNRFLDVSILVCRQYNVLDTEDEKSKYLLFIKSHNYVIWSQLETNGCVGGGGGGGWMHQNLLILRR